MNFGIVDWYDIEKGFGVIKSIDLKEVFIHKSQLSDSGMTLNQGDTVSYEEEFDQRKKRSTAKKCEKLKKEYLKNIFELLLSKNISYTPLSTLLKKISTLIDQKNDLDVIIFNVFNKNQINFKCIELINALTLNDALIGYVQNISKSLIQPIHWIYALTEKQYETLNQFIYGDVKYEIPEELLIQNVSSINPKEFKTLSSFSYFNNFLDYYINLYSATAEWLDSEQCYETYNYLKENNYNHLFKNLEGSLVNYIQIKLDDLIAKYSNITNIHQYKYLKDDFNKLFKYSKSLEEKYFKNVIRNIIDSSSNSDIKLKAYIDLHIDHLSFSEVKDIFKRKKNFEAYSKTLIKLLLPLSNKQQIDLLFYTLELSPVEKLNFIIEFIADYDDTYSNIVVDHLSNKSFWENKDSFMIIEHTHDYLANKVSEKEKLELLLLGYVNRVELKNLLNHIDKLSDKLLYQCISLYTQQEKFTLLKAKLDQLISLPSQKKELNFNGSKYNKIENYYLAKDYRQAFKQLFNHTVSLTNDQKYQLELNAYENVNIKLYVDLWKSNLVEKPPLEYILDICKNPTESIELGKLINLSPVSLKDIQTLVLPHLIQSNDIDNRSSFYETFNLAKIIFKPELFYQGQEVKECINIDKELIISSTLLNLYAWILVQPVVLNYSKLKKYILFFNHDDQILILKKLFVFKLK
ncbi:cold-shock protein, partial [Acinetobacter guillouiae]|uniref:cold-shock protein n=1 Tax=Acinetobacter guillouiae TaxID=106649 RepID=UPI00125F4964